VSEEQQQAKDLLSESLGGTQGHAFSEYLVGAVALLLPMVLVSVFTHWNTRHFWVEALIVLMMVVSLLGSMSLREWALASWRTRHLWKIGYGFDARRYLELLSLRRRGARVVVNLTFDAPWTPEHQKPVPAAVTEWTPGVIAKWNDERVLQLESKEFSGKRTVYGNLGSSRFFSNQEAHECFMKIVDEVVPKLQAVTPISHLEVDLTGTIVSFEADPNKSWGDG
jgi:hypothetical protein